ncbi:MAG TPA: TauD/TfdA family dioxygenase [Microthrixaceae bacterium]|nr:TauD/TfdA family dioxygenase [Microthrixaceae bacterium]
MTTATFTHTDLTPRVGSLIEADLPTLLGGSHAAELRDLLEQRSVVAIRGIEMDDAQQIAFSRTLGEVESSVVGDIYKVTFDRDHNPVGYAINKASFFWHIDRTDLEVPPFASMLSAKVLTPTGGQTEFVNTYAAYEDLPAEDKERLDDIKVLHTIETAFLEAFPEPTEKQRAAWKQIPKQVHPLVWHHRSGRNSLVLSNSATRVIGMDEHEGRALLSRLLAWATQPQFVYQHEWQVNDLVIWNNTGAMHRVRDYDPDYGRMLHRTTLIGDEPFDTRKEADAREG